MFLKNLDNTTFETKMSYYIEYNIQNNTTLSFMIKTVIL